LSARVINRWRWARRFWDYWRRTGALLGQAEALLHDALLISLFGRENGIGACQSH
jgi:hypothetical protein